MPRCLLEHNYSIPTVTAIRALAGMPSLTDDHQGKGPLYAGLRDFAEKYHMEIPTAPYKPCEYTGEPALYGAISSPPHGGVLSTNRQWSHTFV